MLVPATKRLKGQVWAVDRSTRIDHGSWRLGVVDLRLVVVVEGTVDRWTIRRFQ